MLNIIISFYSNGCAIVTEYYANVFFCYDAIKEFSEILESDPNNTEENRTKLMTLKQIQ